MPRLETQLAVVANKIEAPEMQDSLFGLVFLPLGGSGEFMFKTHGSPVRVGTAR